MSDVFYMPDPDIFGVWKNDDGKAGALTEFKEGASVFKFSRCREDESFAFYSICEETSAQRAGLVGLRRWMSAVCAYEGFAPANTRQIKTTKEGIAQSQGDGSWKVKDKAEIEFIL